MRVVSHPEADQELEAAALWYDERQPGLGDDLLDEFEHTLRQVLAEPKRWRKIRGDNRKLNFRRFPYALVYSVGADAIYIKAVMHLWRRPFYWQHRERYADEPRDLPG
jgi:toxin ParE1/3/4